MPFKGRFEDGPIMAKHWMLVWYICDFPRTRTSIAKEPKRFVIFQDGRALTPLDPCMSIVSYPKELAQLFMICSFRLTDVTFT